MISAVGSIVITTPAPLHDLARRLGRLAAMIFESMNMLRVSVPRDDFDALIKKPTSHGGTHQADAQQPDAGLRLRGLADDPAPVSVSLLIVRSFRFR